MENITDGIQNRTSSKCPLFSTAISLSFVWQWDPNLVDTQHLTDLLWYSTNKSKTQSLGDTTHVVFCSFIQGKIKVPSISHCNSIPAMTRDKSKRRGNDSFLAAGPSLHGNSKKIYHVIKLFAYIFQKKIKWHNNQGYWINKWFCNNKSYQLINNIIKNSEYSFNR